MLKLLELTNFRTHLNTKFLFRSPLTFIVGKNASGKTNILESIYINSLTKSYRSPLKETVTKDQDFFKITSSYQFEKPTTIESRLQLNNNLSKKQFFVNKVKKSQKNIVGIAPVVLFEPMDLQIITAGPEKRRVFLDILLSQADPTYLQNLTKFKRLLRQRNQLLKQIIQNRNKAEDLFVYNIQLVEPIFYLVNARDEFLRSITQILTKFYQDISSTKNMVKLNYLPSIPPVKEAVLKELEKSLEKDLLVGYTVRGPHRDNIIISLDKDLPPESLSRGEVRTLSLALKLSELQYLTNNNQHKPILLLDDVLSELDLDRQSKLWQVTNNNQVIITATHLDSELKLPKHHIINLPT